MATLRVYLRQSLGTDKQTESVPTQRQVCERFSLSRTDFPAWSARVEYVEIDRTGDDNTREELLKLIQETKPGDVVVSVEEKRLWRDAIEYVTLCRDLVQRRKARLFYARTGEEVVMRNVTDAAMQFLKGMGGQTELETTRARTREALQARARDGYATGTVPFGYKLVPVDPNVTDRKLTKKRIEIDPARAEIVRRMFAMYLTGKGSTAIARTFNREQLPSPRGKGWNPKTVERQLREERYVGRWEHGVTKIVGRKGDRDLVEKAPESEVIRRVDPKLVIIDSVVWEQTQAQIKARHIAPKVDVGRIAYALSGVLRCGVCGSPLSVKDARKVTGWKRSYYVCSKRADRGDCNFSLSIPAMEAEEKIKIAVTDLIPQIMVRIREAISREIDRQMSLTTGDTGTLETEIATLKASRKRLVALAESSEDDLSEITDRLNVLNRQIKDKEATLQAMARPAIPPEERARIEAAALAFVERVKEGVEGGEPRKQRDGYKALFPKGLRFDVEESGAWVVSAVAGVGLAVVSMMTSPDGKVPP